MTIYADTSFLVSLYTPDANSEPAARLMRRARLPVLLTALGELELANALQLRVFRRELDAATAKSANDLFRVDVAAGIFSIQRISITVFNGAMRLSRQHAANLGTRTLDLLHVASALALKADELYTFDQSQRRLAKAIGLATG